MSRKKTGQVLYQAKLKRLAAISARKKDRKKRKQRQEQDRRHYAALKRRQAIAEIASLKEQWAQEAALASASFAAELEDVLRTKVRAVLNLCP